MPPDEAAWVERARAGESDAFAVLVARYERRIFVYLLRQLGGQREDAADLAQQTFLKAFRSLPTIDAELNFNAWLYRIAANTCRDWQRHRLHFQWLPWDPRVNERQTSGVLDDPEERLAAAETRREVRQTLRAMRPSYRRALMLAQFDGLSCQDIGVRLGLSRSAVKSLLHRARAEFRTLYQGAQPR